MPEEQSEDGGTGLTLAPRYAPDFEAAREWDNPTPGAGTPPGVRAVKILNTLVGVPGILWHGLACVALLLFGLTGLDLGFGSSGAAAINGAWNLPLHGARLVLAALLVVSAVGLARMEPWGRQMALATVSIQFLISMLRLGMLALAWRGLTGSGESGSAAMEVLEGVIFEELLRAAYPTIVWVMIGRQAVGRAMEASEGEYSR